jgi:photosystem II stability/assembly factor-like uncharacterized protein
MKRVILAAALAWLGVAAYGLPGDLVVWSEKEVRPDEAAGLYYLGQGGGGYLYNGSTSALAAVAPYRLLDREAQAKDYYIVWAPEWVPLAPEAFASLGEAVRLSESEILVGLERGFGPADLRAVEHRIELIKLMPVTPVEWSFDGEAPPRKKDPRIAAAINTITAEEYGRYVKKLQDFGTRYADSPGFDYARDYLRSFFYSQNLDASEFHFAFAGLSGFHYPAGADYMYADSNQNTFKRSRDRGATWEGMSPNPVALRSFSFWLDGESGFVAGRHNALARTRDAGATWESVTFHRRADELCSVRALYFVTEEAGWVAGSASSGASRRDFLKRTEDGGRRWVELSVPADLRPSLMAFYDATHGWISGFGAAYYTDDGGVTLRRCVVPLGIRDLAVVGPREAWATCSTSQLMKTSDGVTWELTDPGVPGDYYYVEFPDPQQGFAAGTALIKTDDGGRNWRAVANAPPAPVVLAFADRDRGVLGSEAELYRTDDGGKTFGKIRGDLGFDAENVIGERRGSETPEEIVIIGGHFDSIAFSQGFYNAPGADDNASGTACAMAAARAFRNMSFARTVRYLAFGAEERGLLGSKAYAERCAQKGEKIVAVLNADMVCYDEDAGARDDFVAGSGSNGRWMFAYLAAVGGLYGQKIIYEDLGRNVSDGRSFESVGCPALGVIEGGVGPGGSQEYPYIHSPDDTLDKLHPELGVRFVRDYAAMLAHLAGVAGTFQGPPAPGAGAVPFSRAFAVYPNPYCYASMTGGVHFVGVKSPATVELYDLAGRRVGREEVATGSDECCWQPAAAAGEAVSPGVYLYRVEGQEQTETGKVVVVK